MDDLRAGPKSFLVRNRSRGTTVADRVRLADTSRARRTGLLGLAALEPGKGLWIVPTQAIHTFWMRFPIDVVFLDRHWRVRRVYHRLAPFRVTPPVVAARSVLELPAGMLQSTGTAVGDELQFSLQED